VHAREGLTTVLTSPRPLHGQHGVQQWLRFGGVSPSGDHGFTHGRHGHEGPVETGVPDQRGTTRLVAGLQPSRVGRPSRLFHSLVVHMPAPAVVAFC
jgi:hypothetical protein